MNTKWTTQKLIITGMLAAVAGVLMSLEFSLPMMPPFYKVDFSEVPSVIALFLLGPAPAACVEVIKIIIKLVTVGTNSMYVGEFANLVSIVLFVLPVWSIYSKGGKTRKSAVTALGVSLPIRIILACLMNAFISLPLYASAMGISITAIVQSLGSVNPLIKNLPSFLILATVPFNLIKLTLNYIVGYFLFERLQALNLVKRTV